MHVCDNNTNERNLSTNTHMSSCVYVLVDRCTLPGSTYAYHIIRSCPYCGKEHSHGGEALGHRNVHCVGGNKSYWLTLDPAKAGKAVQAVRQRDAADQSIEDE